MPSTKRSAGKKISEEKLLADAKKALKQTQKVLKAELKKVDDYVKALDGHNSFTF